MIMKDLMHIKNVWMIYNLSIQSVKRILRLKDNEIPSNFDIIKERCSKIIELDVVKMQINSNI